MSGEQRTDEESNSLRTPQGEPALTHADGLPGTREPVVIAPKGNAGESPALFDDYGHDPDLDENGICRVCGKFEPE